MVRLRVLPPPPLQELLVALRGEDDLEVDEGGGRVDGAVALVEPVADGGDEKVSVLRVYIFTPPVPARVSSYRF